MKKTPVEAWIRSRMKLGPQDNLTREDLTAFQLDLLSKELEYARGNSPFYKKKLANVPAGPITSTAALADIPFTTEQELREEHLRMLAVSQDQVARVVTLQTSGTTNQPKRIYFTDHDIDLSVDFFHYGITTFVEPGQKVLILMPGPSLGSVGDILSRGLERMNGLGIVHGPVTDPDKTLREIMDKEIDALVGLPTQVLSLVRRPLGAALPQGRIKNVLLSADYAPKAIIDEISTSWNCRVFDHYGMTEMGLGGGVQCEALSGYHLREAELLFEIVDPDAGTPVPDGQTGEVVFSTLLRQGMPLIRYRTGDLAAFMTEACPCGSVLRPLDRIQGRIRGSVKLAGDFMVDITLLDEAIFEVPGIINYTVEIFRKGDRDILSLKVFAEQGGTALTSQAAQAAAGVPVVRDALASGRLELEPVTMNPSDWISSGSAKRKIIDHRMEP